MSGLGREMPLFPEIPKGGARWRPRALLSRTAHFLYHRLVLLNADRPWFAPACFAALDARLGPETTVWEWGSGASTLFFAKRCARVKSIEHDRAWFEQGQARLQSLGYRNVEIVHVDRGASPSGSSAYAGALNHDGQRWDVIVVDGKDRLRCLESALRHVAPTGVVIVDNSERAGLVEALQALDPARWQTTHYLSLVSRTTFVCPRVSLTPRPNSRARGDDPKA